MDEKAVLQASVGDLEQLGLTEKGHLFLFFYLWICSSGRIYKAVGSAETLSRSHGHPEIYN